MRTGSIANDQGNLFWKRITFPGHTRSAARVSPTGVAALARASDAKRPRAQCPPQARWRRQAPRSRNCSAITPHRRAVHWAMSLPSRRCEAPRDRPSRRRALFENEKRHLGSRSSTSFGEEMATQKSCPVSCLAQRIFQPRLRGSRTDRGVCGGRSGGQYGSAAMSQRAMMPPRPTEYSTLKPGCCLQISAERSRRTQEASGNSRMAGTATFRMGLTIIRTVTFKPHIQRINGKRLSNQTHVSRQKPL
jgi:hypothetical protein